MASAWSGSGINPLQGGDSEASAALRKERATVNAGAPSKRVEQTPTLRVYPVRGQRGEAGRSIGAKAVKAVPSLKLTQSAPYYVQFDTALTQGARGIGDRATNS